MNFEDFKKEIELIEHNFNFKVNNCIFAVIFEKVKRLDTEAISKGLTAILSLTRQQWNKKFGYSNSPAIADWIGFFSQRLIPEQQATIEAERIIDTAQAGYSRVLFDNQFTNMTAEKYGLGYIDNQLNNIYLDKRKDRSWIKKELTEIWLNCYYDQKTKSTAVIRNQESSSIEFIGDKVKCQILLNSPKPIEDRSPALDKLVSSLNLKQKPRKFNFEAAKKKQLEFLGAANSNELGMNDRQKLN